MSQKRTKTSNLIKQIVAILILTNIMYASDILKKVEQAYLNNDYNKAKQEFLNIPSGYDRYKYTFKKMEKYTKKFLINSDNIKKEIDKCKKLSYKCNQIDTFILQSNYETYKSYSSYFSKEFQIKINSNYKKLIDSINNTNNIIVNGYNSNNNNSKIANTNYSNIRQSFNSEKDRLQKLSQKQYGHKLAYKSVIKLTQKFINNLEIVQKDINKFKNDSENIYFETALDNLQSSYKNDYQIYKYQLSNKFQKYIKKEYDNTIEKANKLMISMKNKSKQEQQLKEKKHKEYIASLKAIDKANDLKIKKLGYKGFNGYGITQFMYHTQQNADIGKFINTAIGCSALREKACISYNKVLKVLQVVDDVVIYHFFKIEGSDYLEYNIAVEKEDNTIYQKNQSFDNDFYVFTGMFTYRTVLNTQNSIPKFKKLHIKQ